MTNLDRDRDEIGVPKGEGVSPTDATATDRDALRTLVHHLRNQAHKCSDSTRGPMHGSEYGNGVSAGLEYAADELEELLE